MHLMLILVLELRNENVSFYVQPIILSMLALVNVNWND
jgi:hypothetical protein